MKSIEFKSKYVVSGALLLKLLKDASGETLGQIELANIQEYGKHYSKFESQKDKRDERDEI